MAAVLLAAGCASPARQVSTAVKLGKAADGGGPVVRLGLIPELADGIGLAGIQLGYFRQALGVGVRLDVVPFTSPAAEAAALAAGQLDAAYLDPVAAVRLWLASRGRLLKVVAGAAAGGHVLVNEASLRPGGRFASSVLVVTQKFLATQPALASALLKGQIQASYLLNTDPARAQAAVGTELTALLGRGFPARLLASSFTQVTYTNDPLASSVLAEARHATAAGLVGPLPSSLAGLYHLGPLNTLLRAVGEPSVPG